LRLPRLVFALSLLPILLCTTACSDSPTSPTGAVAFTTTDLRVGTGAEAVRGNTVSMHYTVWLYDATKADLKGLQIETSIGDVPFDFTLGAGTVIAGWDQGIAGMRVGGQRRLIVPASLAYGDTRRNAIPPNTPLVFDVELIAIKS
jgi:FKBP-type peptidyl-prolyl cis-trans isomerase FkpA